MKMQKYVTSRNKCKNVQVSNNEQHNKQAKKKIRN